MATSLKLKLEARRNIVQAMNSSIASRLPDGGGHLNEGSIVWIIVWAFNLQLNCIIKNTHARMQNIDALSAPDLRTHNTWQENQYFFYPADYLFLTVRLSFSPPFLFAWKFKQPYCANISPSGFPPSSANSAIHTISQVRCLRDAPEGTNGPKIL
jgi:hypothetical protein